ncbi:MAG: ATP-dependent 6-phosphofructokinase [Sedimentisphaerales bacterium]|jgi:6-phosphofructokinase 1|nr:ATP-dependent 6-phosphofructokinase [Sedimentisphaerales bacterium]NLT77079.1 ATP-dependent 6-phosphofructokinase [Planctomycetota bacterium]
MAKAKLKSIAVMTGGGDCPGLNAVIRAVTKTAINDHGLTVWGIQDGYLGFIENRIDRLTYEQTSNILTVGGTILGSSNTSNPFHFPVTTGGRTQMKDVSDRCLRALKERDIDALVCIGGDGTMASAAGFAKKGLTVIGVPKTIDNDLAGTDVTFGFDTAVTTATEAIDKVHTTASSHQRVMIVEVMGRYAGWIALYAGAAGGADVILLPEIPYKLDTVCQYVIGRSKKGKRFSIIVVSEGAKEKGGQMVVLKRVAHSPDPIRLGGIGEKLAEDINRQTGLDCRAVVLGHVQRGGTPTPRDRTLATMFGHSAIELLAAGVRNRLVVWKGGGISSVPLASIAGKIKKVPKNHPLVRAAKAIGATFGV